MHHSPLELAMNTPIDRPSDIDTPLEDFSHCHAGILGHLDAFEEIPRLIEPAQRLRRLAEDFSGFFRDVVFEHHQEEERELFVAVLDSARKGDELERVRRMVGRLTREHRDIEEQWSRMQPEMKKLIKGQAARIDPSAIGALVAQYKAHARFEETEFLPLSREILGRDGNHMAALGMSLHIRRTPLTSATEARRLAEEYRRAAMTETQ